MKEDKTVCENCQTLNSSDAENCYYSGREIGNELEIYDDLQPYRQNWSRRSEPERRSPWILGSIIGGVLGLILFPAIIFLTNPSIISPASLNAYYRDGFAAVYVPGFFALCAGSGALIGAAIQHLI